MKDNRLVVRGLRDFSFHNPFCGGLSFGDFCRRLGCRVVFVWCVFFVVSCSSGGGGGSSAISIVSVSDFDYIEPHSDYVILNWTNPRLGAREGIYQFTISYEAVAGLSEDEIRILVGEAVPAGLDGSDSVERAVGANVSASRILDWDDDGVLAESDNCLYRENENQLDSDRDRVGDACDSLQSSLRFIPAEDYLVVGWLAPEGLEEEIRNWTLSVEGPSSYSEYLILSPAEVSRADRVLGSLAGERLSDLAGDSWWYLYNRSDLVSGRYSFSLGVVYTRDSGSLVERDLTNLNSPVNLSYSGRVALGLNHDRDDLIDSLDGDDDNDGIADTADAAKDVSALRGSVVKAYGGNTSALALYTSGGRSFYRLDGLAPDSYYRFEVRAHIRSYANEALARQLGYSPSGEEIRGAYGVSEKAALIESDRVLMGRNTDNDDLVDLLDPDDDGDGLLDVLEPVRREGNREIDCSLVADCDRDGLTDNEEYYIGGDSSRGVQPVRSYYDEENNRSYDCLVTADCDRDGVYDGDDLARLNPLVNRDTDGDGIEDNSDNCAYRINPGQEDEEGGVGDGRGDLCEGAPYYLRGNSSAFDMTTFVSSFGVALKWRNLARDRELFSSDSAIEISEITLIFTNRTDEVEVLLANGTFNNELLELNQLVSYELGLFVYDDTAYNEILEPKPRRRDGSLAYVYTSASESYNLTLRLRASDNESRPYDLYHISDLVIQSNPFTDKNGVIVALDNDEYGGGSDLDNDNDGLLNADEPTGCSKVWDCDGDGIRDGLDLAPLDPSRLASMDSDGDGVLDLLDAFPADPLRKADSDEDGLADLDDSCIYSPLNGPAGPAWARADGDGDRISAVCDANDTVADELWLTPRGDNVLVSWWNERALHHFDIYHGGYTTDETLGLNASDLEGGSLQPSSYSHYLENNRGLGLPRGVFYFALVNASLNANGSDFLVWTSRLSVEVGPNTDGDHLADSVDTDDDNDGLADTHQKELLRNAEGVLCSLLEDCDGDGLVDRLDPVPTDDSDLDGVGDKEDAFATNEAESADSDYDGVGDNADNCDLSYNPSQADRDGDGLGDLCDSDNDNLSPVGRISGEGETYHIRDLMERRRNALGALVEVKVGEVLASEVLLNWRNPTEVYLPYALPQPLVNISLDSLQVQTRASGGRVRGEERINDGAGFNLEPGERNDYRIRGLESGQTYELVVIGRYSYAAARRSAAPNDLSRLRAEVVLGTVEVETPMTESLAAVTDFAVSSGVEAVELSWTNPHIPTNTELLGFKISGCRLSGPDSVCVAETLRQLGARTEGLSLESGARNRWLLDESFLSRGYLYDLQLRALYVREGVGGSASSQVLRAGLYPTALPLVDNFTASDGEGSFNLTWNEPPDLAAFTRMGEGIAGYSWTVRLDSATGPLVAHRLYEEEEAAALNGQLRSEDLVDSPQAGRRYHITMEVLWTTGQRSPPAEAFAAVWPQAGGVSDILLSGTDRAIEIGWTNPALSGFEALGEGISHYEISLCREDEPNNCTLREARPNWQAAELSSYSFGRAAAQQYDLPYEVAMVVHYTTGQRSAKVFSGDRVQLEQVAHPGVSVGVESGEDSVRLRWTNPAALTGLTIKEFRITPCKYANATATSCTDGSELALSATTTPSLSTDYGASVELELDESDLDRAYLYSFKVKAIYEDGASGEFESVEDESDQAALYPEASGVLDFGTVSGLGNFTLFWRAPAAENLADFARIGAGIAHYIVGRGIDNAEANSSVLVPPTSPNMTVSFTELRRLLLEQRRPMLFELGEIYLVNASIRYTTGQKAKFETDSVALGPRAAVPLLGVVTGEDNLTVSWHHQPPPLSLSLSFFTLEDVSVYNLAYIVGFDCVEDSLSCAGTHEVAANRDSANYSHSASFNVGDLDGLIARGVPYDITVWANWTKGEEERLDRSASRPGGILPSNVSVAENLTAASRAEGIQASWSLLSLAAGDELLEALGYEERVLINASNADDNYQKAIKVVIPVGVTSWNLVEGIRSGELYQVELISGYYIGRGANKLRQGVRKPTFWGGKYPSEAEAARATNLMVDEQPDALRASWSAPTNIARPRFIEELGYEVSNYSVVACPQVGGGCVDVGTTTALSYQVDDTMIERFRYYRLGVRANYHGKEFATATEVVPQPSARPVFSRRARLLPFAAPVRNLRAIQIPEVNEIAVRWTNPDPRDFQLIGVTTADYRIQVCRGDDCSFFNELLADQPLLQPPDRIRISTLSISPDSDYRVRVTVTYSNGQISAAVDSAPFSIARASYPPVNDLQVHSGEQQIQVLWNPPDASSTGATINGYRLRAVCRSAANNDCDGRDYEQGLAADARQANISAANISRGLLYDVSVITLYQEVIDEEETERQPPHNPSKIAAIYPLPEVATIPLEVLPAPGEMTARWDALPALAPTAFSDYFGYERGDYWLHADDLIQLVAGNRYSFLADGLDHPNFEAGRLYEVSLEGSYRIGNQANGIANHNLRGRTRLASTVGGAYPMTVAPPAPQFSSEVRADSVTVQWLPAEPLEYLDGSGARRPIAANFSAHYDYSLAGYRVRLCLRATPTNCLSEEPVIATNSFTLLASQIPSGSPADYDILVAVLHQRGDTVVASRFINAFDGDEDGLRDPFDVDDDGDGLIEIRSPAGLDAVRHQVNGSGLKMSATAVIDRSGCGNGAQITECNGYELATDLDLSDYIETTYGDAGWLPIGDPTGMTIVVGTDVIVCQVGSFTAVFDGNDHTISGLRINRPNDDCAALFAAVSAGARIRNLNLVAARLRGRDYIGSLVGHFPLEDIVVSRVSATSISIEGSIGIGGLVGGSNPAVGYPRGLGTATIIGSSAVTGNIAGVGYVGGLIGNVEGYVISSFAVTGNITASTAVVGGLIGQSREVVSSYAVTGDMPYPDSGGNGGLVVTTISVIGSSYALFENIDSGSSSSGLTDTTAVAISSYWDSSVGSIKSGGGGEPKNSTELTTPTDFSGIYADWDDGLDLDNADGDDMTDTGRDDITRYCDRDGSGAIEAAERSDDNLIWDLGTASQYPAIRCGLLSPAAQRALYSVDNGSLSFRFPTPVTALAARQLGGTNRIEVSWTSPDLSQPTEGGATARYRVEICRQDSCPLSRIFTNESLQRVELSSLGLAEGSDYRARLTLIYADNQVSTTLQSAPFAVARVTYLSVSDIQVAMDYDTVTVSWSPPEMNSAAATVTGYRLMAVCRAIANNDCSAGNYEMTHPAATVSARLGTDAIARGVLYDISIITEYDAAGQTRQSPNSVARAAAILPDPPAFAAEPEALAGAGLMSVSWQPISLPPFFTEHLGYRVRDYVVTVNGFNHSVSTDGTRIDIAVGGGGLTEPATLYDIRLAARYRLGTQFVARQFLSRHSVSPLVRGGAYPGVGAGLASLPTTSLSGNDVTLSWDRLTQLEYIDGSGSRQPVSDDFKTQYDYEVTGYRVQFCPAAGDCYEEDLREGESSFTVRAGETKDGFTFGAYLGAYMMGVSVLYGPDEYLLRSGFVFVSDLDGDGVAPADDIDDDGDGLIEISTAAELDAVRWALNGNGSRASATTALDHMGCGNGDTITECNGYELTADINLTDYIADTYGDAGWQPIAHTTSQTEGCPGDTFSALFDGNDYTISGLRINRRNQSCVGLFGSVRDVEIRRLNLRATSIAGAYRVGGLVGQGNNIRIESSSVAAVNIRSTEVKAGGLAGRIWGNNFINSMVVNIGDKIIAQNGDIGGLIGSTGGGRTTINTSSAIVDTLEGTEPVPGVEEYSHIGGIIGFVEGGITINESFAVCRELKARRGKIGGLVGRFDGGSVSSSYAVCEKLTGIPVPATYLGNCLLDPGTCAALSGAYTGGLVAENEVKITSSLAISGSVRHASSTDGGLVQFGSGSASDSYWDADTSGISGSEGRSTVALRSPTGADGIYGNWDDTIWDFGSSSEYPALKNNFYSPAQQRSFYSLNEDGNLTVHPIYIDDGLLLPGE